MKGLQADMDALLGTKKKPTGADATKILLTRDNFHMLNQELLLRSREGESDANSQGTKKNGSGKVAIKVPVLKAALWCPYRRQPSRSRLSTFSA